MTDIVDPFDHGDGIVDPFERSSAPKKAEKSAPKGGIGSDLLHIGLGALQQSAGQALAGVGQATDIKALVDAGSRVNDAGAARAQDLSEEGRAADEGLAPSGELLHPSTWSLGPNPTLRGALQKTVGVAAGVAPLIAQGIVTEGRALPSMATMGILGGGGAAIDEQERIARMPDADLAAVPGYKERLGEGLTPAEARADLASAAGRRAFQVNAPISAATGVGEAIPFQKGAQETLGRIVGDGRIARSVAGAAVDAPVMGAQGVLMDAAQVQGANEATGETRDPWDNSFGKFAMGTIGGIAIGAGAGLARGRAEPAPHAEENTENDLRQQEDAAVEQDGQPQHLHATVVDPATGPLSKAYATGVAADLGKPAPEPVVVVGAHPSTLEKPNPNTGEMPALDEGSHADASKTEGATTFEDVVDAVRKNAGKPLDFDAMQWMAKDLGVPIQQVVQARRQVRTEERDKASGKSPQPAATSAASKENGNGNEESGPVRGQKGSSEVGKQGQQEQQGRADEEGRKGLLNTAPVDVAAHQAATSPKNDLAAPTPAQLEAGNFQMGHHTIGKLDVTIEHPAGVLRKPEHTVKTAQHYGYVKGTVGADGEHVDAFFGPEADNVRKPVFVVDQLKPDGSFDEHKAMLGFHSVADARKAYLANYPEGWKAGDITQMSHDEFAEWVKDKSLTGKPAKDAPVGLKFSAEAKEGPIRTKPETVHHLVLANKKRPQGVPLAEVRVVDTHDGTDKPFAVGHGYMLSTEGGGHSPEHAGAKRFASADEARTAGLKGVLDALPKQPETLADKAHLDQIRAWVSAQSGEAPAATEGHPPAESAGSDRAKKPPRAAAAAKGGAPAPASSGQAPAKKALPAAGRSATAKGKAASASAKSTPQHTGPKMWVRGSGKGNAQAVLAKDGSWHVRHKQSGQWQEWKKVDHFDPSPLHGYKEHMPERGAVVIPGTGRIELGPRAPVEPKGPKPPADVLEAIARSGGLDREAFKKEGVDPADFKRMFGVGNWLFAKTGGKTPHDLREWMEQADIGFLPEESAHGEAKNLDTDALDLLMRGLGGEKIYPVHGHSAGDAEAFRQREHDEREQETAQYWAEREEREKAEREEATTFHDDLEAAGIDVEPGDEAEALTLVELVERLAATGMPRDDIEIELEWMEGRPHGDKANQLYDLIQQREALRAAQPEPTAQADQSGVPPQEAGEADAATALELAPQEAPAERPPEVKRPAADLFAPPTPKERADAALQAKQDQLDGKTGAVTPGASGLPLFAGKRPEQATIPPAKPKPAADTVPEGWDAPKGSTLATSKDPVRGGIVDQAMGAPAKGGGTWFFISNDSKIEPQEGFATRAEAFAALHAAIEAKTKPAVSKNTVFTDDGLAKALAVLKAKRGNLNSGLDPELFQAGVYVAGHTVEKGLRTFAAYAKAMVEQLGDWVKPHLASWYMALKHDARAADFKAEMDSETTVESKTVEAHIQSATEATHVPGAPANLAGNRAEPAGSPPSVEGAISAVGPTATGGTGQAGGRAGKAGSRLPSDAGLFSGVPTVDGEPGNQSLLGGDRVARPALVPAGSDVDARGGGFGDGGVPVEHAPAAQAAPAARAGVPEAARGVAHPDDPPSLAQIRKDLPELLPGQQEDVHKAETRFALPHGYGMLFTNSTGTGKTYTGLGIVKRLALAGKRNVLIAVPSDKIAQDWIATARALGLNVRALENITDNGRSGAVVTTYANMRQNRTLADRTWDHVLTDEAHYLAQDKEGTATDALAALRAITYHPDGAIARDQMLNRAMYDQIAAERERLKALNKTTSPELDRLAKQANDGLKVVQADVAAHQGEQRTRATFLSATPFAYEKTIDWADGYLFHYVEPGQREPDSMGYNSGSARDRFFMQHFGYRMRYNKLTEPDAKVDRGLLQRQFNALLRRSGVLSGRTLDVPHDYDRRFILIKSAIGQRIDEALAFTRNQRDAKGEGYTPTPEWQAARNAFDELFANRFDYLSRRYLLEAIKATEVLQHVRDHMALGRKVVVFHDYKKGGGFNPFDVNGDMLPADMSEGARAIAHQMLADYRREFADLIRYPFATMPSPIQVFKREFPGLLLFNGDVPPKQRRANVATFNDDGTGPQVMLVQKAAGKEGISLHDTTGRHQRAQFNLGQPTEPTAAIQQEGRTYRVGQASNAIFRYLNTGTNWEKWAFATTIANRASAAENLAAGEQARALKDAFIAAFEESGDFPAGHEGEGTGGKERDAAANNALTEYDRAKAFYWGTQKKNSRTKSQEGTDYFATPEPLGLKMVQWANGRGGERALEPSAGHGAIARWFGDTMNRTAIEPSDALSARLAMVFDGKIMRDRFESLHVNNKFDTIVMNPPFGSGGRTAIDHLAKAAQQHLAEGGRVVALIPTGPAADAKFEKWFYESVERPTKPVFEHPTLGAIYKGDKIKTRAAWGREGTVVKLSADGHALAIHLPGTPAGNHTFVSHQSITDVEPTGKRTETHSPTADLDLVADIRLPQVTFERAGTGVATRIVVIDKLAKDQHPAGQVTRDYSDAKSVDELFERIENSSIPDRTKPADTSDTPEPPRGPGSRTLAQIMASRIPGARTEPPTRSGSATSADVAKSEQPQPATPAPSPLLEGAKQATYTTKKGKVLTGVVRTDLSKEQAQAIDPYTFKHEGGWFIRGKHLEGGGRVEEADLPDEETSVYGHTAPLSERAERGTVESPGGGRRRGAPAEGQMDLFVATKGDAAPATGAPPAVVINRPKLGQQVGLVRTGQFRSGVERVRTLADAAHIMAPLRKSPQEQFLALALDANDKPIAVLRHTIGVVDSSLVDSGVVTGALTSIPGIKSVVFGHNHPSGSIAQSGADMTTDGRLRKLLEGTGIDVRGAIIVGPGQKRFTSYDARGFLDDQHITPARRTGIVPMVERSLRKVMPIPGRLKVVEPSIAINAAKRARAENGVDSGILLLNNKHELIGVLPMLTKRMGLLKTGESGGARELLQTIHESGANAAMMFGRGDAVRDMRNVGNMLAAAEVRPVDIITHDGNTYTSEASRGHGAGDRLDGYQSRPEPGAARGLVGVGDLQRRINQITRNWKGDIPTVRVVESARSLPREAQLQAGVEKAEGWYDGKGTIYLVGNNIRNLTRAEHVLAHEAFGHFGIEAVTGKDQWTRIVSDVARLRSSENLSDAMKGAMASTERRYGNENSAVFARELLAVMAERNVKSGLLGRVMAAVRRWLGNLGLDVKGFEESDLRALVARGQRQVETGGERAADNALGTRGPALSTTTADGHDLGEDAGLGTRLGQAFTRANEARRAAQDIKAVARNNIATSRGYLEANWATSARNVAKADAAVESFRKTQDLAIGALRKKGLTDKALESAAYADIVVHQRGERVENEPTRQFLKLQDHLLAGQIERLREADREGRYLQTLREHYFHQLWQDRDREHADEVFKAMVARRPLAGDKAFTKEKFYQDYQAGIDAGLHPASINFVDAFMSRYQSGEKLVAALSIRNALADRGWAKPIPKIVTKEKRTKVVDGVEKTVTVKKSRPGRMAPGWTRVNDGTFQGLQVPAFVARDINNYLAQGLAQFKPWRGFRWFQNALLSARLGVSLFHAGMTTLDSLTGHLDLGVRYALRGDLQNSLASFADAAKSIPHTLQAFAGRGKGAELLDQYLGKTMADANTSAILHFLERGGARARMNPGLEYNDSFTKAVRSWRQAEPLITKGAGLKANAEQVVQRLGTAAGAAVEATTRLVTHRLVPAQKMMARYMLAKFELDRLAKQFPDVARGDYAGLIDRMSPEAISKIAGRINADVDDRLGQMTYDNLHMHRMVKDALQTGVQSVGWNWGSLRLLLGGIKDVGNIAHPKELGVPLDKAGLIDHVPTARVSSRLAYLVTLNATVAVAGAMLQKLLTDQWPTEGKDYFFPKTGRVSANGSAERLSFPSYVKDEWAYASHPIQTLEHKLHPTLSMMAEVLQNKDYYGDRVYDPDGSVPQHVANLLTYMGKGFTPYAVQGALKNSVAEDRDGQPHALKDAALKASPFIGVAPAPADISHTPFEEYVQQRYVDTLPQGARAPEDAAKTQARKDAMRAIRQGEQPDTSLFSPAEVRRMRKDASQDVFATRFGRLSLQEKLRAYDLASAQEREQYRLRAVVGRGLAQAVKKLPDDEREQVVEHARRILAGEGGQETPASE